MRFKSSFTIPAVAAMSLGLIGVTVPAAADILHVPGDFPTIQEAIDAAMDGDEVEVQPGTYFETINFLGKAIRVYSTDGPDVTIIDAQKTGTTVTCDSGEGPNTLLEAFTITGGIGGFGGGMRNINSSPTVTNCTFNGNTASRGGGMYNDNSSSTLTNCTFSGNTANSRGGGLYNNSSSTTLTNCTFSVNTVSGNLAFGGGMFNDHSNPTLTNCTFSRNTVTSGIFQAMGGGMNNSNSSPTLINCTFSGNSALTESGSGGGMHNGASSPTMINCTFSGNTAAGGGAMRNSGSSMPMITNCTFMGNSAAGAGGGILNSGGSPTVTNCTFSGNTAPGGGSGMYSTIGCCGNGAPIVHNCILWDNDTEELVDVNGAETTVSYSDVQGGWPGVGNIDADPLFVAPGSGDLRLMPGSPCIDAADNTAVPKGIETDLDGNPRFVDDPDTEDTGNGDPPIVDMGAYEFQVTNCPWDVNSNGVVDHHDIVEVVHNMGRCDDPDNCPWDVNGDGVVNGRDVAAVARHLGACP